MHQPTDQAAAHTQACDVVHAHAHRQADDGSIRQVHNRNVQVTVAARQCTQATSAIRVQQKRRAFTLLALTASLINVCSLLRHSRACVSTARADFFIAVTTHRHQVVPTDRRATKLPGLNCTTNLVVPCMPIGGRHAASSPQGIHKARSTHRARCKHSNKCTNAAIPCCCTSNECWDVVPASPGMNSSSSTRYLSSPRWPRRSIVNA